MAGKRYRLVNTRKAAGFSQEQLAEAVDVERSTVMRWERARPVRNPGLDRNSRVHWVSRIKRCPNCWVNPPNLRVSPAIRCSRGNLPTR
jgi:hypothetical protein